jgi:cystathionine beta-lyase
MPHPRSSPFDLLLDRAPTSAVKWAGLAQHFGRADLIPLWLADMDLPAPPCVTEALVARAAHPIYGYTERDASYFEALTGWLQQRHGWRVPPAACLHAPGVVTALSLCVSALTRPGEGVIIMPPIYPPFFSVVRDNGRKLLRCPLRCEDGRYTIDFELLRTLAPAARLLLFCHPHNPVGRVWHDSELAALAELCAQHGVIVVSDEIHSDLVFAPARHRPFAAISEVAAQASVTCVAPSKTFNLAGLQASALIATNPALHQRLSRILRRQGLLLTSVFAHEAFRAAYRAGAAWLEELLAYLRGNRDLLIERLGTLPPLRATPPEATYLAWIDFRGLDLTTAELDRFLVSEAGLALSPGHHFGSQGAGFQRLNFGCPRPLLERALDQLASALAARRGD